MAQHLPAGARYQTYSNVKPDPSQELVDEGVAAVEAAVEAGVAAVGEMGAEVYSSVVIPRPHPDLKKITQRYCVENLLPY